MVEDFMCNLKVYRVAQGLTQEQQVIGRML